MFAKHALHHPWLVGGADDLESELLSDAKELRRLWFAHAHLFGRQQRTQLPGKLYRRLLHHGHLLVTKHDAHQPSEWRERHLLTRLQFELGKARVVVMLGELNGWVLDEDDQMLKILELVPIVHKDTSDGQIKDM